MARNFLLNWVSENVQADAFQKGRRESARLANRLAADAADQGFSKTAIEEAAEQRLADFLYMAMNDAALLEERLAERSTGKAAVRQGHGKSR